MRLCVCAILASALGVGGAAATSLHVSAPFAGAGIAPGVRLAGHARGYCWTTSIADERRNAYRCFVGNAIHDPCFASSRSARFVLCPLYLPTSRALRIDLTKRLPPTSGSADPRRGPPWALRLANGRWCTSFTGATGLVNGLRISYGCTGGGILLGDPNRRHATWTIPYAATPKSHAREVAIAAAWW